MDAQRDVVRSAAVELFVARGSAAVSIAEICARAGVSRPTFYRCFEDKEALLASLYQQAVNQPIEQIILQHLTQRGSDRAWLRGAVEATLDAIFEQHHMAMWLYKESSDRSSVAYRIVDTAFDQAATVLLGWLPRPVAQRASTRTVLKSVMAACQWIAHDAMERGLTAQARSDAKQAAWVVVEGMLEQLHSSTGN